MKMEMAGSLLNLDSSSVDSTNERIIIDLLTTLKKELKVFFSDKNEVQPCVLITLSLLYYRNLGKKMPNFVLRWMS